MTWFGVKRQTAGKQATCGNNCPLATQTDLPLLRPLLHSGLLGGGKMGDSVAVERGWHLWVIAIFSYSNLDLQVALPSLPAQYHRPIRSDIFNETMPSFYMVIPHNLIGTAQVPFKTVCEMGHGTILHQPPVTSLVSILAAK